jgi:hypothetical protein
MFKGVSQCMPTVGTLYFGLFNPFHYSPLPLYLPPPIFQQLSIYILILSTSTSYVLWYYWCSIILFSFHSFPKFHRIVPLLKSCSTSEFVYDHACFCVYVYLLDLSSMYERKHVAFVFLSLANLTYHDVLRCYLFMLPTGIWPRLDFRWNYIYACLSFCHILLPLLSWIGFFWELSFNKPPA